MKKTNLALLAPLMGLLCISCSQDISNRKAAIHLSTLLRNAEASISGVMARAGQNRITKPLSSARIRKNQDENGFSLSLECKTEDWWDDFPTKRPGKHGAHGQLHVAFYYGRFPGSGTPFISREGLYYGLTRFRLPHLESEVVVYSRTGQSDTHDILVNIVKSEFKKNGMNLSNQPRGPASDRGDSQ